MITKFKFNKWNQLTIKNKNKKKIIKKKIKDIINNELKTSIQIKLYVVMYNEKCYVCTIIVKLFEKMKTNEKKKEAWTNMFLFLKYYKKPTKNNTEYHCNTLIENEHE